MVIESIWTSYSPNLARDPSDGSGDYGPCLEYRRSGRFARAPGQRERRLILGFTHMTTQEHKLIIGLFAKQMQLITILLQILKSRDLVEKDDAQAFEFAVTEDDVSNAALLQRAKASYLQLAKSLGIETGLERP
jgi:hypothetical protein